MQRLIKGLATVILCLQWSLPASAQPEFAMCDPVVGNPSPLVNTSPTELDAEGSFQLTCSCPSEKVVAGGAISLSTVSGQSTTRNGLPGIRQSDGDAFTENIMGISYSPSTTYFVRVSAPSGETLEAGSYSVAVKFELSSIPQCQFGGG